VIHGQAGGGTGGWVVGVSPKGTFVCPEELVSPEPEYGPSNIPSGWTVETY
jgi:hypothetical protein